MSSLHTKLLWILTLIILTTPIQAFEGQQAKIQRDGLVHNITTELLDLAEYAKSLDGGSLSISLEVPKGVERANATLTIGTETRDLFPFKRRVMMPPGPDNATTWLSFSLPLRQPDPTARYSFQFEVSSQTPFNFTRILLGEPSTPQSRIIGASGFKPTKSGRVIKAGEDLLGTHQARQFIRFPPGFLGQGVAGYEGMVPFGEDPFQPTRNNIDTVMVRSTDVEVGGTVKVRLLKFQNRTVEPITAQSVAGPRSFEIRASLSPNAVSEGFVTINEDGTYQSSTALYPVFTIQQVENGKPVGSAIVVDTALVAVPGFPFYLASQGGKWTDEAPAGRMTTPSTSNFFYNNGDSNLFVHSNGGPGTTAACAKASALAF